MTNTFWFNSFESRSLRHCSTLRSFYYVCMWDTALPQHNVYFENGEYSAPHCITDVLFPMSGNLENALPTLSNNFTRRCAECCYEIRKCCWENNPWFWGLYKHIFQWFMFLNWNWLYGKPHTYAIFVSRSFETYVQHVACSSKILVLFIKSYEAFLKRLQHYTENVIHKLKCRTLFI